MSILYSPDDFDVEVVVNHDVCEPDYSFDILLVVRDKATGKLYAATDSGCSCPVPFEDHSYPTDFTEVRSWENVLEVLHADYPEDGYSAYRYTDIKPAREAFLAAQRPQRPEERALYRMDLHIHFVGPLPAKDNKAAPEVSAAHRAAVEAAQETLRDHGFELARTGTGSVREGTVQMEPNA